MHILAAIPPPPSDSFSLGPLTVRWYGLLIAIGVLVAISVLRRRYTAYGGDPDLADRTALWAVGVGFLGARLAYVSTNLDRFFPVFGGEEWRPLGVIAIWEGGLALYGGLVLGTIFTWFYLGRAGGSRPHFMDAVAPGIPLAQAIGRWGNYFNQELFGTETTLPWALRLTDGRLVHPTFLYESLYNILLAVFLLWLGKTKKLATGSLLFVYAIGYSVARFFLQLIRTDTEPIIGPLRTNAYVAIIIVVAGTIGLIWWQRRGAAQELARTGGGVSGDAEPAAKTDEDGGDAEPVDAPDETPRDQR